MFKLTKLLHVAGLGILLLTLVLLLTGCFDIHQVIWLGTEVEDSSMRVTFTTTSEEIFQMLKATFLADTELEEGAVSFEVVEPETSEGETEYKTIVVSSADEETIFIAPYDGGRAYEFSLLSDEEESSLTDETRALFEGHTFHVELHFPQQISEAWWGRIDVDEKRYVDEDLIKGKVFSFKTDFLNVYTEDFSYLTVLSGG